VRERGVELDVLPLAAPDTGLRTDMREVRAWLEPHWGGARVLCAPAGTGAFSAAAAKLGASEVVSVDPSALDIARAEANLRANGLEEFPHEVAAEDVLRAFDRFRRTGRRFDRVILDPPAYGPDGTPLQAKRELPRLVAAAARVVDEGGWLVVSSDQGEVAPKAFDGLVADGLRRAERDAQVLHLGTQGPDYPSATWFPEGRYLKVRVLRLL
jgi:23S rRNA (cytosine1962-C5)-methyltransferase